MLIVSEGSLNIFLKNFFLTDWVTGYSGQVGLTHKNWMGHGPLCFCFRLGIFRDGLGQVRKF